MPCVSCISIIHCSKVKLVYGVHTVKVPIPGRCMSVGTVVQNYGATDVAPTQKDKPLLSSKRRPHFQTHKLSWNEHELGHGS
jgi:hypothetical protein